MLIGMKLAVSLILEIVVLLAGTLSMIVVLGITTLLAAVVLIAGT